MKIVDDLVIEMRLKCPRCGVTVSISKKKGWSTTCYECGKTIELLIGMGGIIDVGERQEQRG